MGQKHSGEAVEVTRRAPGDVGFTIPSPASVDPVPAERVLPLLRAVCERAATEVAAAPREALLAHFARISFDDIGAAALTTLAVELERLGADTVVVVRVQLRAGETPVHQLSSLALRAAPAEVLRKVAGLLPTHGADRAFVVFDVPWTELPQWCAGATPVRPPAGAGRVTLDWTPTTAPVAVALAAGMDGWLQAAPARAVAALKAYSDNEATLGDTKLSHPSGRMNAWLMGNRVRGVAPRGLQEMALDVVAATAGGIRLTPAVAALAGGTLCVYTGIAEGNVARDAETDRPLARGTASVGAEVGWFRRRLTSCSLAASVAVQFARGTCCVFKLRLVPPMRVLPMWTVSAVGGEDEILVPPGYAWRVVAVDDAAVFLGQLVAVRELECTNPGLYESAARRDELVSELRAALGAEGVPRSAFDRGVGPWLALAD